MQRASILSKVSSERTTLRHNLTKLNGRLHTESVAFIQTLTTMECKVAHEIRYIAVRLYKASKAIDKQYLKVGFPILQLEATTNGFQVVSDGPDDIKFFVQRSDYIFKKPYNISTADLGEIEDLYYATCAKVKALRSVVNIYIDEGFRAPNFEYFSYDSPGLRHLAPVELSHFRTMLEMHETALYSERLTKPLNAAVLEKNWCLLKRGDKRCITADSLLGGLRYDETIRQGQSMNGVKWSPQVQGLQDLRNKPCGLVFAELTEKYNPIARKEKAAKLENEQRRALSKARTHPAEIVRDPPAPKLGVVNGERVDTCDPSECEYRAGQPGQPRSTFPFEANNNPSAQLMLAGLALPDASVCSRTLDTVETRPSILEKAPLKDHGKVVEPFKLSHVPSSTYTPTRQHDARSVNHPVPSSSRSGPFRSGQVVVFAGMHTKDLVTSLGGNHVQTAFPGGRNGYTLPASALPDGDETSTEKDEQSEVVMLQLRDKSRGTLLGAEAYGVKGIKDGRKRASSELSSGNFKRHARSGP